MIDKIYGKVKYWAMLLNPLFLALFYYGMRTLFMLCKYGGVRRRLSVIVACAGIGLMWIFVWSIIYSKREHSEIPAGQKTESAAEEDTALKAERTAECSAGLKGTNSPSHLRKIILMITLSLELVAIVGITVFWGSGILQSASNYNGKLAWKINEILNVKKIRLKHDNIYEDGLDGVFKDLETRLKLPEELYLSNKFELEFKADGTITDIYSFFYGRDEDGNTRTFLVTYDHEKGNQMEVYLDGNTTSDYAVINKLEPMFELFDMMDVQAETAKWQEQNGADEFGIMYWGYRSFGSPAGIVVFREDGSEGRIYEVKEISGEYSGYEVSLHVPEREDIIPIRYMNSWDRLNLLKEAIEKPFYEIGTSVCVRDDGSVYFLLNEEKGWRLTIRDAAAGSRWYGLEITLNGGESWSNLNDDPFLGSTGVADEIHFYDEEFGFIHLGSASDMYGILCLTRDGGETFEKVELPREQINDESLDIDQFHYVTMPIQEGTDFYVELRCEKYDSESILFVSKDGGVTWEFAETVDR